MTKTSFNETYDIICHMEPELYKKLPKSFLDFIKQNMEENYEVNIDYSISINKQELERDTRILLSLIYRDYLCSAEEKKRIEEKDKQELQKIEQEKLQKYNPDNIFAKPEKITNKEEQPQQQSQAMIEYKEENFFQKLWNKIKNFFGRK